MAACPGMESPVAELRQAGASRHRVSNRGSIDRHRVCIDMGFRSSVSQGIDSPATAVCPCIECPAALLLHALGLQASSLQLWWRPQVSSCQRHWFSRHLVSRHYVSGGRNTSGIERQKNAYPSHHLLACLFACLFACLTRIHLITCMLACLLVCLPASLHAKVKKILWSKLRVLI